MDGERVEPPPAPAYLAVDAILYGGKMYVRCEAIAAALDLVYVKGDGSYSKTDSAVIWDSTSTIRSYPTSTTPTHTMGIPIR